MPRCSRPASTDRMAPITCSFREYNSPETNNGIAANLDGDRYDHAFGMVRRGRFRLEGLFGVRDKIIPNASYGTIFNDPSNRTMDNARIPGWELQPRLFGEHAARCACLL